MMASSILSPAIRKVEAYTYAAERNHTDFAGAAANVEHHGTGRFADRQVGADGGGHRLLNQVHLRAPAPMADSRIARRSTWVEPHGTQMTMRGDG